MVPSAGVISFVRTYPLPPMLPVLALVLMPVLSFVNSPGLWWGLPKMVVWAGVWCLCLTPTLLLSNWLRERSREGNETE